jgi:hypothetical protein
MIAGLWTEVRTRDPATHSAETVGVSFAPQNLSCVLYINHVSSCRGEQGIDDVELT